MGARAIAPAMAARANHGAAYLVWDFIVLSCLLVRPIWGHLMVAPQLTGVVLADSHLHPSLAGNSGAESSPVVLAADTRPPLRLAGRPTSRLLAAQTADSVADIRPT